MAGIAEQDKGQDISSSCSSHGMLRPSEDPWTDRFWHQCQ